MDEATASPANWVYRPARSRFDEILSRLWHVGSTHARRRPRGRPRRLPWSGGWHGAVSHHLVRIRIAGRSWSRQKAALCRAMTAFAAAADIVRNVGCSTLNFLYGGSDHCRRGAKSLIQGGVRGPGRRDPAGNQGSSGMGHREAPPSRSRGAPPVDVRGIPSAPVIVFQAGLAVCLARPRADREGKRWPRSIVTSFDRVLVICCKLRGPSPAGAPGADPPRRSESRRRHCLASLSQTRAS